MKKIIILMFLCVVTALTIKHFSSHEKRVSSLLLYNVEALASDDEHAGIGHCIGEGSLDCPIIHIKVKYILGGYSLEME